MAYPKELALFRVTQDSYLKKGELVEFQNHTNIFPDAIRVIPLDGPERCMDHDDGRWVILHRHQLKPLTPTALQVWELLENQS